MFLKFFIFLEIVICFVFIRWWYVDVIRGFFFINSVYKLYLVYKCLIKLFIMYFCKLYVDRYFKVVVGLSFV